VATVLARLPVAGPNEDAPAASPALFRQGRPAASQPAVVAAIHWPRWRSAGQDGTAGLAVDVRQPAQGFPMVPQCLQAEAAEPARLAAAKAVDATPAPPREVAPRTIGKAMARAAAVSQPPAVLEKPCGPE